MPEVTIGDGAIIGARAIVTKDVPPYTIAAGNPARHIRQRFDEKTIKALQNISWRDWPNKIVIENAAAIVGKDLNKLIEIQKTLGL